MHEKKEIQKVDKSIRYVVTSPLSQCIFKRTRKIEFLVPFCLNAEINLLSSSENFITVVLLLWFLTVTCSCCPYLYFGSALMLVTYFVNFR